MRRYRVGAHTKSDLKVHLVWVPKYRKPVLTGELAIRVRDIKTVPHVTLKSIANNPDIREGLSRKQIDAAISKYADQETLYHQPEIDRKKDPRDWPLYRGGCARSCGQSSG